MTLSNAGGNLARYTYLLGAAGNRTQVTELSGRTVNYVYDDLYRLTSETIANSANNGAISYQFDAVGNSLQRNSNVNLVPNQTSTFDANDRIGSDTFDANGNTKVSNGKTYNYDFENKLTSTSDGITITYDGDGNRVSKAVGGVTTRYLVDTNNLTGYAQVVEEVQGGSVVKAYTYGHDLICQRITSGGVSFYGYDGHGSVRTLSDGSGSVTDTYDFDAFGNLISQTGTTNNGYLYAGEQFDADLNFSYNRARYLNLATGRFVSLDNYEGNSNDPGSLHKYLYANADPINRTDPSGNVSVGGILAGVAIIGIIAAIAIPTSTSLFRGALQTPREPVIQIDDQPVIVEGSGWDDGIVASSLEFAAQVWKKLANIEINTKPIVRISLPTVLNDSGYDERLISAKLAEQGVNSKHITFFLGSLFQNLASVEGAVPRGDPANPAPPPYRTYVSTAALTSRRVVNWWANNPAGGVVAHEWGHSFNLDHTLGPGLMSAILGTTNPVFFQHSLSDSEIESARAFASNYR